MDFKTSVELAQDLIRQETTSLNAAAQRRIQEQIIDYATTGDKIDVRRSSAGAAHPWAVLRTPAPRSNVNSLAFVCHVDCVPTGDIESWSFSPFETGANSEFVRGRGSVDMKAGLAIAVSAFMRGSRTGRTVDLILTSDEEVGSLGARACLTELGGFDASAIIIPEATNNRIALGHRGALWARLTSFGKAAHGSMPDKGTNAITRLMAAIESGIASQPLPSDDYLGQETINVGTIHGGTATNIVPDRAFATIDARTTGDHDRLLRAFDSWPGIDAVETIVDLPPVTSDPNDTWIQSIPAATNSFPVAYFTDGAVFRQALPHCPIIVCGPGSADQMHAVDETMPLSELRDCYELYNAVVDCWT